MPHHHAGYLRAAETTPARFDPNDREDALAAFCARTFYREQFSEDNHPLWGSDWLEEAVNAYNAAGITPRPVPFTAACATGADHAALIGFEERFADHSPSLVLGAVLSAGMGAAAPDYTRTNDEDLKARLIASGEDEAKAAPLHLGNIASLPQPYSLLRAMRLLSIPPSDDVAGKARILALPHIDWCINAYLTADAYSKDPQHA